MRKIAGVSKDANKLAVSKEIMSKAVNFDRPPSALSSRSRRVDSDGSVNARSYELKKPGSANRDIMQIASDTLYPV